MRYLLYSLAGSLPQVLSIVNGYFQVLRSTRSQF